MAVIDQLPDDELGFLEDENDTFGVSYIIPCFNHGEFVQEAINSCLTQRGTFKKEILIIDDGSTEEQTLQMLENIENWGLPEVQVISHPSNEGLAEARNTGFENAEYELVVPLDADDKLSPAFTLACLSAWIQQNDGAFVYTDVHLFGAVDDDWILPDFSFERLRKTPFIVCTSLIEKDMWRAVVKSNGFGYDPELSQLGGWEDYLFYLEATALNWKGIHVSGNFFQYRKHEKSSMIDGANANLSAIQEYIRTKMLVEYGLRVLR